MRSYQRSFEMKSVLQMLIAPRWLAWAFVLPLLATMHFAMAQTTESGSANFDHVKTGFVLSGAHAQARCASCHTQGVFKGTPRDCMGCHMVGNRMGATSKPGNHISTFAPCASCHRTSAWTPASFSHAGVAPGSCASCHNGSMATGKPSGHPPTTASCDSCHRTSAWLPAGFNHTGVPPGTCPTCHTPDKPPAPRHPFTTSSCDSCHRTTGWLPATFSHTGVAPGTCLTCHADDKPPGHPVTVVSCDNCHNTSSWALLKAGANHFGVLPGTCGTCHNGTKAIGKPSNHIPESQLLNGANMACDACHTSKTSFATLRMNHNASQGNGSGWCKGCHLSGTSYSGGMERKSLNHEASGKTDCSTSGCHRPLGIRGTAYSSW